MMPLVKAAAWPFTLKVTRYAENDALGQRLSGPQYLSGAASAACRHSGTPHYTAVHKRHVS
uniref:Uncharacterized protein n=1 Tax=Nymphaea colorata TaxID=210225 RepID=A0A5K0WJB0_9MAGN